MRKFLKHESEEHICSICKKNKIYFSYDSMMNTDNMNSDEHYWYADNQQLDGGQIISIQRLVDMGYSLSKYPGYIGLLYTKMCACDQCIKKYPNNYKQLTWKDLLKTHKKNLDKESKLIDNDIGYEYTSMAKPNP